jgi:hypothetical protein
MLDLYSTALTAALVTSLSTAAWANPHSVQYPTSHTLIAMDGIPVDVPPPRRGQVQTDAPPPEHPNPSISQPAPEPTANVAPNDNANANVNANASGNGNANGNANETPPPPKKERMVPGGAVNVPTANLPPPGGTAGNASPQTSGVPERRAPEHSPTPPGYPFGSPQGSYAPAGPSPSGPTPGYKSYPQQ